MGLRAKSKMRLAVLSAAVIGTGVLLGGAYAGLKIHRMHERQQLKPAGLASLKAGELVPALNALGTYLNYFPEDMEVVKTYAELREKLPEAGHKQIVEAVGLYRRLVAVYPKEPSYRQKLLKLYSQGNMNTEVIQGADEFIRQLDSEILKDLKVADGTRQDADGLTDAEIKALQSPSAQNLREKYLVPLTEVLQLKAESRLRLLKSRDALVTARQLIALDRTNLESGDTLLRCMYSNKESADTIASQIQELIKGREDTAAAKILQARMKSAIGDKEAARKFAVEAAKLEMPNDKVAIATADMLDRFEEFGPAREMTEAAYKSFHTDDMEDEYFQRLIYREEYKRASDELAALDNPKRASLIGMHIMAQWLYGQKLEEQGNRDEGAHQKELARGLLKSLDQCAAKYDLRAKGWNDVLRYMYFNSKARDRDVIEACQKAASADDRNPFFAFFLGNAYEFTGDANEALQQWSRATLLAPSWSRPLFLASQHFARVGSHYDALLLAQRANICLPNQKETLVALAIAWGNCLGLPKVDGPDVLLKFIADHSEQLGSDVRVVPLRVLLLGRTKRVAAAEALVREVASKAAPADKDLLLALSTVCHQAGLDRTMEETCLAKYEELMGNTSELAVTRCQILLAVAKAAENKKNESTAAARDALAQGDSAANARALAEADKWSREMSEAVAAARKEFETRRSRVPAQADSAVKEKWELARCQLQEALKDPQAHDGWKALLEAYPGSETVQWAAVSSPSVRADHVLLGQALERIKAVSPEPTLRWRIEKGDWLIREGNQSALEQAVSILRETVAAWQGSVQARQELAAAYVAGGNRAGALAELTRANELEPHNPDVMLNLAELYFQQKDAVRASENLKKALAEPGLGENQQMRAGLLLAQLGDRAASSELLLKVSAPTSPAVVQLQGQLLWQKGDKAGAVQKFRQLTDLNASPEMIQQAMVFFSSIQNDLDQKLRKAGEEGLQVAMARLKSVSGSEAVRHFNMGCYLGQTGKFAEAVGELAAAVKGDASNETYRRKYIALLLLGNQIDDAVKAAADAHSLLPHDAACSALAALGANKSIFKDVEARNYFASCILKASEGRGVDDVVAVLRSASSQDASGLAKQLQRLAVANQGSVSLQVLAIEKLTDANLVEDALALSQGAMNENPTSPQLAYMTAMNLIWLRRWSDALVAVQRWREIAPPTSSLESDLVLAATYIGVKRFQDASALLENSVKVLKADDPGYATTMRLLISSDVEQDHFDSALKRFTSMIQPDQKDNSWRQFAVAVATTRILQFNNVGSPERADMAKKWLRELDARTSSDNSEGRLAVGLGWYQLGKRAKDKAALDQAWSILDGISGDNGGDPAARSRSLVLVGALADGDGRLAEAERDYRRALELDSSLHQAMNNLAMLLARSGKQLEEADSLAVRAIQAAPKAATYYDTHAFVLRKAKKFDQALTAIDTAITLEPRNPEWLISKAEILLAAGQKAGTPEVLRKIDSIDPGVSSRPDLKSRYDALKKDAGA